MLPIQKSQDQNLMLMQTNWSSQINPLLAAPQSQGIFLKQQSLSIGSNNINHLLGRKLQGWQIIRQRASSSIYDTQDSNLTPSITLQLVSSAKVVVDLFVF